MRGGETMNPFWAVSRYTSDELKSKNSKDNSAHKFNVMLSTKQYQVVTVGMLGDQNLNLLSLVDVPMLVNPDRLGKGDNVILEVQPKKGVKRKEEKGWKDAVQIRAKATPAKRPTNGSNPASIIDI